MSGPLHVPTDRGGLLLTRWVNGVGSFSSAGARKKEPTRILLLLGLISLFASHAHLVQRIPRGATICNDLQRNAEPQAHQGVTPRAKPGLAPARSRSGRLCKTIAFCKSIQQFATQFREPLFGRKAKSASPLVHPWPRRRQLGDAEAVLLAAGALRQDTRVPTNCRIGMAKTQKASSLVAEGSRQEAGLRKGSAAKEDDSAPPAIPS